MESSVYDFFATYIHPEEGPRQWLSIVVLVFAIVEWSNLVRFWIDKEGHPRHQWQPQDLSQPLLSAYRWRVASVCLLSALLCAFLVVSLGLS